MPEQFFFSDLRELFAKANEEKSGDRLAGIAAGSERKRVAAKRKLADLSLDNSVSKLILESFDREAFRPIKSSTVGESVQRLSRSLENFRANTLGLFRGKLLVTMQVNHRRIEAPMSQLHLDSIWVRVAVSH